MKKNKKRTREAVRAHGLKPPVIDADTDLFSMTFIRKSHQEAIEKRAIAPAPRPERVSEGVSEGVDRLLVFIRHQPGLRVPQLSAALDVPAKTLERWIRRLRVDGRIEFRGSPKTGGYWQR